MANQRLPLLLIALLAIAVSLVLGAIVLVRQLTVAQQWVSHTYQAQLITEELFGALRDAEASRRGFLLTSDPAYLQPFDSVQSAAGAKLSELHRILSDNPSQTPRLAHLDELVSAKFAELNATISKQRSGLQGQAIDLVRSHMGKDLMDSIRLEIGHVTNTENALLNDRLKFSQRIQTAIQWTGVFALGALVGLGSTLYWLYSLRLGELEKAVAGRTRHLGVITAELAHRTKNQLSLVQSIANQTARYSRSVPEFLDKFGDRLQALSRSTTELTRHQWHSANLHELFSAQLAWLPPSISRNRITVHGPPIYVSPTAAHYLGLAIHELTTNALKHGALSNERGRISALWSTPSNTMGSPGFKLTWSETDGPLIAAPPHKADAGFGSTILGRLTAAAVSGKARSDYRPDGLVWTLEATLTNVEGEKPPNEAHGELTAAAPVTPAAYTDGADDRRT